MIFFLFCLTPFSMTIFRSIHVARFDIISSFYSLVIFRCIYVPQLLYPSVDGHLGCFHLLAIVNSATMNTGVHVSFSALVSSGYMPRSGIDGSYGGFTPRF